MKVRKWVSTHPGAIPVRTFGISSSGLAGMVLYHCGTGTRARFELPEGISLPADSIHGLSRYRIALHRSSGREPRRFALRRVRGLYARVAELLYPRMGKLSVVGASAFPQILGECPGPSRTGTTSHARHFVSSPCLGDHALSGVDRAGKVLGSLINDLDSTTVRPVPSCWKSQTGDERKQEWPILNLHVYQP